MLNAVGLLQFFLNNHDNVELGGFPSLQLSRKLGFLKCGINVITGKINPLGTNPIISGIKCVKRHFLVQAGHCVKIIY